jgi:hypothetical protein
MKKLSILTCTMIALASFMVTTVRADSPHYINGPTAALNNGDYCVSFKEAGLGSTPITYTITAGEGTVFTYQCFTKSGNNPQGAPNFVKGSGESTTTTITPHNGQITATLCLTPTMPPTDASCQGGGLILKLIAVDYDNVTFTDTGTNHTFTLQDLCSGSGCP